MARNLQADDASKGSHGLYNTRVNLSELDLPTAVGVSNDASAPQTSSCMAQDELGLGPRPPGPAGGALLGLCHSAPQASNASFAAMLCSIQPTVIFEKESSEGKPLVERDNDVLRDYFADRTNIVLTSTSPEVSPHIVITPAEETVEGFYIPYYNRVDYHLQNPHLLMVPWRDPIRLVRKPYLDEQCYWPVPRSHDAAPMSISTPRRVFRKSHFDHFTELTANERLTMNHVVTAVQRHRFKIAAIETSERAKVQRERYDDGALFESFEKPFSWTDPAVPLLKYAGYPGIVIFDSPNPFTAPHIMLCTPPQQDPWVPYAMATNDPQDGGFGRYLVVPSPHVSFINMEGSPFYDNFDSTDNDYDCEACDSSSESTSSEPTTPFEMDEDPFLSWSCTEIVNGDEEGCSHDPIDEGSSGGPWDDSSKRFETQDLPARPGKPIFYFDNEEDDELPPLDDWYLSVAQRNGLPIVA